MQGNKNKQILKFDPEIERTLRKLRKQSKQVLEGSSEEVFEEVVDNLEEIFYNMAVEGTQEKTLGEYSVPTTGNRRDKPTIVFDHEIEKTLKKNRSRVKA
ncbi:hypothetical protein PIB30_053522 [Stylosanthes scabra]|uniref:Uncharacterized protein n=1 Tax=Stylosanthes scabra TaxID=79078 RepID=A0ABU6UIW8_9FABA|nr:hypothetical protein [Stylosanthes scabra]